MEETKVLPAIRVEKKLHDDLSRVLAVLGYRRTDYMRRALADAVRRDMTKVKEAEAKHG